MDPAIHPAAALDAALTEATVPDAFAAAVVRAGTRMAVQSPTEDITYAALDSASDALAAALDAVPGDPAPVLVLVAHGVPSVIAMVGIAKSGRAFLVLDPHAPDGFLAETVDRHGGGPCVTDRAHVGVVRSLDVVRTPIVFDDLADAAPTIRRSLDPSAPLSVSHTSGSAGVPKAVVHSHRNVVANATRYAAAIGAGPADTFLVTNAFAAAASATPVFGALLTGATLCTFDLPASGPAPLPAFVASTGVTIAHVAPAALRSFAGHAPMPGVRLVSLGGDRLGPEEASIARDRFPNATLLHRYSTSETNWIAGFEIAPGDPIPAGPVPLGGPVPWLRVEIVDEVGEPVPPGEAGELVVTGDHLALGYLGDPERTAARFRDTTDGRSYRTGDRVRVQIDGVLEFAGRTDDVRKVRGVLVDLTVVEAALARLDDVDAAAVVTTDVGSRTELVAFVAGPDVRAWQVRRDLARRLPTAMVPGQVVSVPEVPLTARGKVDRAALVAAAANRPRTPFAEPLDDAERAIAELFAAVLSVERVGRDDDLFALGADSLALVELQTGLHEQFGREVGLPMLLEHPTTAELAGALEARDERVPVGDDAPSLVRVRDGAGKRTPVVLFSGGGGGHLEGVARLAHELSDRTAYAVVPNGFFRRARPDRTIGAMADRAARALLDLGVHDRLVLVGHSSGGNIALETGRRLQGTPIAVPLVVLLDSLPITPEVIERRALVPRLRDRVASGRRDRAAKDRSTSWARQAAWALLFTRTRVERRWRAATAGVLPRTGERQHRAFDALVRRALVARAEPSYAGAVHLVRADDVPGRDLPGDLRWSQVGVGSLTIDRVACAHDDLVRGSFAVLTGRAVEAACARADANLDGELGGSR